MLMYNRVLQKNMRRDHVSRQESYASTLRVLIMTIVPVILSTAVYNISGIVDQGVFKYLMLEIQASDQCAHRSGIGPVRVHHSGPYESPDFRRLG